jgi:hypothetical protein
LGRRTWLFTSSLGTAGSGRSVNARMRMAAHYSRAWARPQECGPDAFLRRCRRSLRAAAPAVPRPQRSIPANRKAVSLAHERSNHTGHGTQRCCSRLQHLPPTSSEVSAPSMTTQGNLPTVGL